MTTPNPTTLDLARPGSRPPSLQPTQPDMSLVRSMHDNYLALIVTADEARWETYAAEYTEEA